MFEQLWLVPLGFAAGVLGSILGLGGGIIVVPVLTFFGYSPTLAASTSLFAAFSNAVASTISYTRQKRIQFSIGLKLGLLSIPGTILGAYISSEITPSLFKILFGLVLIVSAIYIFINRKIESKQHNQSKQVMLFAVGASFFAGIISSLFGIGGGIVFVPLMVIVMGLSMKEAAPTSQFILLFASAAGLAAHSALGHPDFIQALLLAAGAFAGGFVGARLSVDIKEKRLKILVSIVMVAASIKLFIDSLEPPF
ncbi:MAG: sulfite exporter TauE/SafE family protein [Thaumarchaeota archaeon]|nr:sulfite exporter TauE/SafE family protein [Nitrososphaerota archaeon]